MEAQLIDARENDIALEEINPLLLEVLTAAILLNKWTCETEVDDVYIVIPEDILSSGLHFLVYFFAEIKH